MNTVVRVETGHVNVTGAAFLTYARRYLHAAETVGASPRGFDPVPYQLVCQAIELYLKAFIWLSDGVNSRKMRQKYGHDVAKLWRHAKTRGIKQYVAVTAPREAALDLVASHYKERRFAYWDLRMLTGGYSQLAMNRRALSVLKGLARRLDSSLRTPILSAS